MAKAPQAGPGTIRFKCNGCGTILKVSSRLAERYIDCPKCKGRAIVPANQKEADEEAHGYGVNKLAFDLEGKCRNCGAKMTKKAIVCVECGFDFRSGRVHELIDKTKLPADYPTWDKIVKSMGSNELTKDAGTLGVSLIMTLVMIGLLGAGVAWVIAWAFSEPGGINAPAWPYTIYLPIIAGLATLIFLGLAQQALVEACSRSLYGRPISAGALPIALLYFLGIAIPAAPLLALAYWTGFEVTMPDPNRPAAFDESLFSSLPIPEIQVLPVGIVLAIIGGLYFLYYFYFGIGAYCAELTINPIKIFMLIGKCFVDSTIWLSIVIPLFALAVGLPLGLGFLIIVMGMGEMPAIILGVLLGCLALSYAATAASSMIGFIAKRHSR